MEDNTTKAIIIGARTIIASLIIAMSVKYFTDGFRYEVVSLGEKRGYLVDRREGKAIPAVPYSAFPYIISFPPPGQTLDWAR